MKSALTRFNESKKTFKRLPMKKIDKMTGIQFEHFVAHYLVSENWKVYLTPHSDEGFDIIAKKGFSWIGVQCKRYSRPVSEIYISKMFTAFHKTHYRKVRTAILFTNSTFTKKAIKTADDLVNQKYDIDLVDRGFVRKHLSTNAYL